MKLSQSKQSMNKRNFLSLTVSSLFACLFLVFCWIFLNGLISKPNGTDSSESEVMVELFQNIAVGDVVLKRFKNQPVWIVHASTEQRAQTKLINKHVIEPVSGCDLNEVYCLLAAKTNHDGVYLHYILEEPPQLVIGTPWFGGFVDPTSGAIYDLIGRAYQQNEDQSVVSMQRVNVN